MSKPNICFICNEDNVDLDIAPMEVIPRIGELIQSTFNSKQTMKVIGVVYEPYYSNEILKLEVRVYLKSFLDV